MSDFKNLGEIIDLEAPLVELDYESRREWWNRYGLAAAVTLWFVALGLRDAWAGSAAVAAGVLGAGALACAGVAWWWYGCSDFLRLDNEARVLQRVRRRPGHEEVTDLARFEDIQVVGVDGRSGYQTTDNSARKWVTYQVRLATKDRRIFECNHAREEDLRVTNNSARALARHLGCEFQEGEEEKPFSPTW